MITTIEESILDRFLDPVAECFTAEVARRIVDLKLDSTIQERLNDLAGKANSGTLTPAEKADYQEYVEGIDLLAIFKAKARQTLARQAS